MRFLIKLAGRALARKIEEGSSIGATIGALLGIMLGAAAAYLITSKGWVGRDYTVAMFLICPIPLAIGGALLGAMAGPHRKPVDARSGIRLTRYNGAAGTLACAALFLGGSITGAVVWLRYEYPKHEPLTWLEIGLSALMVLMTVIAVWVALYDVWYVHLGQFIDVKRLIGRRSYAAANVRTWGFEIREGVVSQQPFTGKTNFCIQFDDGRIYRVEVDGKDSGAIVELFSSVSAIR